MTVPLVAEFSACTSAYGRLAPLPPVAAADAGWTATAATPATTSDAALAARASVRLTARMDWNTCCSFAADGRISSGGSRGAVWPGGGGTVQCGTVYKRRYPSRHKVAISEQILGRFIHQPARSKMSL